jgi:E3 ubiquitin-protein ligase RNF213
LKQIEKTTDANRIDSNLISQSFPKVINLLKKTILQLNNDFENVVNVIQLFLTYFHMKEMSISVKNNHKRHDMIGDLRDKYDQVIYTISECLKQKCNKSIIVNYGIDTSNLEKTESKWHQQMLEDVKRKQLNRHDQMNGRKKFENSISYFDNDRIDFDLDDFENFDHDIRLQQRYSKKHMFLNGLNRNNSKSQELENNEPNHFIETNEEYKLYMLLLSVKTSTKAHSSTRHEIESYENQILNILNSRLNKSSFYELVLVRSLFNFDVTKSKKNEVLEHFNKVIIEKLTMHEEINIEILCKCLDKNEKLLQYFINQLIKDKLHKENISLMYILEKSTFFLIYEQNLISKKSGKALPLDKNQEKIFNNHIASLVNTLENIAKGEETLFNIKLFKDNSENFMKLIELIQKENLYENLPLIRNRDKTFEKLFKYRMKEVDTYEDYKTSLKAFLQFCSHFKQINIKSYEKQLEDLSPVKKEVLKLSQVCKCISTQAIAKSADLNQYFPDIYCFGDIKHKEIIIINQIINLDRLKCILFDFYFAESCNDNLKTANNLKEISLQVALTDIYQSTLTKWKQMAKVVENGTIKLQKIEELLSKHFSNNFKKLYDEFFYMCHYHKISNHEEQMSRIDRYNRFRSSVDLAKSIEEIRKSLKLKKNFNEIKDLLNIKSEEFKDWTINKMDNKVEITIQTLSKMSTTERNNNEKLECLKAFVNSVELVEWLRTNIKDIKELKYFVEIVSTTKPSDIHNQNSNRALLPKTLKEAGIAFAPLIFDLKVDDGFDKFMSLCQTVWSHLENDKKISQKLMALKDEIPVLESIRVKKSNVELSAINQAKQFNEKGVYKIGFTNSGFYSKSGEKLESLKNISKLIELEIELEMESNDTSSKTKAKKQFKKTIYNLERLKETQNLLMLVAKKSKSIDKKNQIDEDDDDDESMAMEYFIEIFNNVVRLAEIYLKLINNGCIFFESFMVKVFCDFGNKIYNKKLPTLTMESKSESIAYELNTQNIGDTTINALKNACVFMENCHDLWLEHLFAIRNEYNSINYYSIKQIIFLRYNLSKLLLLSDESTEQNDTDMAFSLLSTICPNLNISNLKNFHQLTLEKYKEIKNSKLNISDVIDDKINKDINKIATDNNFNLNVVKKAFKLFGSSNKNQIIDYCIENDTLDANDQTEINDENQNDIESNIMNMSIDHKVCDNDECMMELDEIVEFSKKIDSVWKEFMKNQNSTSSRILSIEHLALFLETINEFGESKNKKYSRRIPGYLTHRGNPNLIICPSREQIPVVLSIYAYSPNEPLPTNDECLFCSSETTSEEVENFFRIAFKSDGRKLYTILNIQDLNYKNSAQVEKFLSSNTKINQTNNYTLVCICSAEKHSQSILASSLIKYRIQPIILPSNVIEDYLSNKLKNDSKNNSCLSLYDHTKSSVRALLSEKPGNGKSTYVKNFKESNLKNVDFNYKVIRIKTTNLNIDLELDKFFSTKQETNMKSNLPTVFHIDIAFEVFQNVDLFLFNLIITSCLKHSNGFVWRRSLNDLYFIEMMPPYLSNNSRSINSHYENNRLISFHSILNYIPRIQFRTPKKYQYDLINLDKNELAAYKDNLFSNFYNKIQFQRTAFYFKVKKESPNELATFTYTERASFRFSTELSQIECLTILLEYSELKHPNWTELNNFVNFLDEHLEVLENASLIKELPELRSITAQFIILMAHDFGLPSLNIGEKSNSISINEDNQIQISIHSLEIARKWDLIFHPYIIFNSDRETFTFMGIYLDRRKYKFINPNNNTILEENEYKIKPQLRIELLKQRVPLYDNFNEFPRTKKINQLRAVMGLNCLDQINQDPDPTYELTLDNCLKLMAIYMRLRSNSPVIIMGETGCGKTRILKFFSDLHLRNTKANSLKHLLHVKIHGGTTAAEIQTKVEYAERMARVNKTKLNDSRTENKNGKPNEIPATTILFFDEANTTEAIGVIKEIMCDLTCNGRPIDLKNGLKIVAAVNPYRKHSDEMIDKLEEAGLGFYMSASDTKEKLGHIPMRQLVYRVQPLPASMIPLVWDFGQLDSNTENVYIRQMLKKALKNNILSRIDTPEELEVIANLLTQSQSFMRRQNDECSFVSLRDIERVIKVSSWFLNNESLLFDKMKEKKLENVDDTYQDYLSPLRRSFLLALSVCYHACLNNKETRFNYRKLISSVLYISESEFSEQNDWILTEILKCQHIFLDQVALQKNIARNSALLENVFMIIICIELRIPLFIVGKPGSSKSLAKSIVANSMEGQNSKTELFRNLKETYFVNFQCSPLTTPEMILESFKEAANFQLNCNLEKTVAVVNLDEIGLAEGSESMPLKALHPLLEEGTDSEENAKPHDKVAVIGISNWALDPAKMNRG